MEPKYTLMKLLSLCTALVVSSVLFACSGSFSTGGESTAKDPNSVAGAGGENTIPAGEIPAGIERVESPTGSSSSVPGVASTTAPEVDTAPPLPSRGPIKEDAAELIEEGLNAFRGGNAAEATGKFEAALSEDPRAYAAAYNLGVLADRAGAEDQALRFYQQALRIQADYERAAEGIVTIHLRHNRIDDAVLFIEPLARRWERNLALQAIYANVLVLANRIEEAVRVARAALRRDERYTPAMVALVKANLKQGRVELAQSILEQAEKSNSQNAEIHFLKAKLFLEQDRFAEAMASLRRAVELRPEYAEARVALGTQLLAGGNYPEAVEQLEQAARLNPGSVAIHLNLGDAYRATKQWQKAKSEFDRALSMQPNLPQAHFNLGLLYMSGGEELPGLDKLAALDRAIKEFSQYRGAMGPKLRKDDPSQSYLEDIDRTIEREKKRIQREKAQKEREAREQAKTVPAPAPEAEPAAPASPPSGGTP